MEQKTFSEQINNLVDMYVKSIPIKRDGKDLIRFSLFMHMTETYKVLNKKGSILDFKKFLD